MPEDEIARAWVAPGYWRLCHGSGAVMEALSGDTGTRLFLSLCLLCWWLLVVAGVCVCECVEKGPGCVASGLTEIGTFAHETRHETEIERRAGFVHLSMMDNLGLGTNLDGQHGTAVE